MLDEILEEREHVAVLVCKITIHVTVDRPLRMKFTLSRQQGRLWFIKIGILAGEDRRRPRQERRDARQAGRGQPRQRHGEASDRRAPRHRLLRQ